MYIFMSQFVSGIGTTMFSILGITYLDDNVKRKQTPMLIGKTCRKVLMEFCVSKCYLLLNRTDVGFAVDWTCLGLRSGQYLHPDVRQLDGKNFSETDRSQLDWRLVARFTLIAKFVGFFTIFIDNKTGFMIIGFIQLGTGWLLACYPRRLPLKPTANGRANGTVSKAPKMDIKARKMKGTTSMLPYPIWHLPCDSIDQIFQQPCVDS